MGGSGSADASQCTYYHRGGVGLSYLSKKSDWPYKALKAFAGNAEVFTFPRLFHMESME